jgi:3-dehydroquinate synthase
MSIDIQSKSHAYAVETVSDLQASVRAASGASVFYLVDQRVRELYPEAFSEVDAAGRLLSVMASEEQKTYERLVPLFLNLIERGIRRNTTLCVVGGGVLQDIGCFIASVLFRGLRWELVPTTLLAQCDSCIGSKSSLNIGPYKNQLGTFYPPHRVLMTFSVLRTLSRDEIRSGLGEAIKLHLIAGPDAFARLRSRLALLPADPADLAPEILDCLLIKKAYIEKDEFDLGVRNLLNYGHTFGHAFESATNFAIPHGIAVTLGISAATYISERLGWVPAGYADSLDAFLKTYFEPFERELATVAPSALQMALGKDKKNVGKELTCILTRGEGRMEKLALGLEEQVMPWLLDWVKKVVG